MQARYGINPTAACLRLLTNACVQAEDSVIAKLLLYKMMTTGGKGGLPFVPCEIACTQLAQALCSASPPQLQDAMSLFEWAVRSGVKLQSPALHTVLLNGCAQCMALSTGRRLHAHVSASGIRLDNKLSCALIDMYGKCGSLGEACTEFKEACRRIREGGGNGDDCLFVWTAAIHVHGLHGKGTEALQLLNDMIRSGLRPDDLAMLAALNACSHTGLVAEAQELINKMGEWGIKPDVRHQNCIVDALGRAGRIKEAERFVGQMDQPDAVTWTILLGACRGYRLVSHNQIATSHLAPRLTPSHSTPRHTAPTFTATRYPTSPILTFIQEAKRWRARYISASHCQTSSKTHTPAESY